MKPRVRELVEEIRVREEELEEVLKTHEVQFLYRLGGARVRFERSAHNAHRRLKTGLVHWLR